MLFGLPILAAACSPPPPPPSDSPTTSPSAHAAPTTTGAVAKATVPGPPGIESVEVENWITAFGVQGVTLRLRRRLPPERSSSPFTRYLDSPTLLENPLLGSGKQVPTDQAPAYPGGFGDTFEITLNGVSGSESLIRRLSFDLPETWIAEADVRTYVLKSEEDSVDLGQDYATSIGADAHKVYTDCRYREGSLPAGFYQDSGRYGWDIFQFRDAKGRRVVWTGGDIGGGSRTDQYAIPDPPEDPLAFPIQCDFIVPRKWETVKTHFLLENIAIPQRPK